MKNPNNYFRQLRSSPDFRSPYEEVVGLQRQAERLLDDFVLPIESELSRMSMNGHTFMPSCDVEDTDSALMVTVDLPGVKKDDITISLNDNRLTIIGEKKEEKEERSRSRMRKERHYGSFERSFALPSTIKTEQIEAVYSDGVLRIVVPKREGAKTQTIKIQDGKSLTWTKPKSVQSHERTSAA